MAVFGCVADLLIIAVWVVMIISAYICLYDNPEDDEDLKKEISQEEE